MHLLSSLSLTFKLPFVLSIIVTIVAATIGIAMVERDRQRLRDEMTGALCFLRVRSPSLRQNRCCVVIPGRFTRCCGRSRKGPTARARNHWLRR